MFAAQLIGDSFDDLVIGLALNIPVITAIAALAYRRSRARANNIFTLVIINIVVFFVTHVMVVASIGVGVGFGLFALFGILRFRTGTIPTVEMGFLFAGIALAALNAIAPSALGVAEVIIANSSALVNRRLRTGSTNDDSLATLSVISLLSRAIRPATLTLSYCELRALWMRMWLNHHTQFRVASSRSSAPCHGP